ncbi:MAG: divergent polysaccharide deacetylase family protein [Pseudolabrys sp.]
MAADDLNAPLGQDKPKTRPKLPVALPHLVAGALGLFGVVVVLWAMFANDPLGGEPIAVAVTTPSAAKVKEAAQSNEQHARYDGPGASTASAVKEAAKPPPGSKVITIIDGSSGKKEDVFVPGNAAGKEPSDAAPPTAKLDPKLLEKSSHGKIPKLGPNGERAATIYAHPRKIPADKADAPKIAIIIGGLGISASGTAEAMSKLPSPVTLAIAPYGADLEHLAERARAEDHEVLLQAPMEPFDYPDNDPGPETLLTSLTTAQNVDRLHWLMSRFQGYVGIVSYMGARFTASEAALAPVLNETAKRGLIYVDDGASSRSVASQIAGGRSFPFAKADVVIDAVPTPGEVDHALARLELLAREHGTAVGMATALPSTIDRLAKWAKQVEARGFVLVPITMVALKPKSS